MPRVRHIANPESVKKKILVRLHERMKDAKDPVVRLSYVTEYLHDSDLALEAFLRVQLVRKLRPGHLTFKDMGREVVDTLAGKQFLSSPLTTGGRAALYSYSSTSSAFTPGNESKNENENEMKKKLGNKKEKWERRRKWK